MWWTTRVYWHLRQDSHFLWLPVGIRCPTWIPTTWWLVVAKLFKYVHKMELPTGALTLLDKKNWQWTFLYLFSNDFMLSGTEVSEKFNLVPLCQCLSMYFRKLKPWLGLNRLPLWQHQVQGRRHQASYHLQGIPWRTGTRLRTSLSPVPLDWLSSDIRRWTLLTHQVQVDANSLICLRIGYIGQKYEMDFTIYLQLVKAHQLHHSTRLIGKWPKSSAFNFKVKLI